MPRELRRLFETGALRAGSRTGPVLVSSTAPVSGVDPLEFFRRGRALARERGFWRVPARDFTVAGIGAAWSIRARGQRRFAEVGSAWEALLADAVIEIEAEPPVSGAAGPVLLGAFAFDPRRVATAAWRGFPDGLLVLPRHALTVSGGAAWLTLNALIEPGIDAGGLARELEEEREFLVAGATAAPPTTAATPARLARIGAVPGPARNEATQRPAVELREDDPAGWMAKVADIAAEVRAGRVRKAVLARAVSARAPRPFSPDGVLSALVESNPSGYHFAVERPEGCFLGASPEQLVELRDGEVRAMALAGSIGRGSSDDEDRRLGQALLDSGKDRHEHAVVVAALRQALEPLCSDFRAPDVPGLLKLKHVQHLHTPVSGRLADGQTILEVLERLHPTPAVGGFPREEAFELIRRTEGFDRGWYAGPVGWIDRFGRGEFAVAIRSALLRDAEATLFAGCGIMGESDPESEYRESCLKLTAMRCALERSLR